jgi:predicted hydrolase (HD superfamily)
MNLTSFTFIDYSEARHILEEHGSKGVEMLLRRHDDVFEKDHLNALAAMATNAGFTEFPPAQILYAAYCTACVSLIGATELTQQLTNYN